MTIEEKELYIFGYTINSLIPNEKEKVSLDIGGSIKNISRKGKFYYLEDWGWTTLFGLYMHFKELS